MIIENYIKDKIRELEEHVDIDEILEFDDLNRIVWNKIYIQKVKNPIDDMKINYNDDQVEENPLWYK